MIFCGDVPGSRLCVGAMMNPASSYFRSTQQLTCS
jgi:hypothetical protein